MEIVDFTPKTYQSSPENKRLAIYILIAISALTTTFGLLNHYTRGQQAEFVPNFLQQMLAISILCCPLALFSINQFLRKIRIDKSGLTVQSIFRTVSWSWNDFASGAIEKSDTRLINHNRRFLEKEINLIVLCEEDLRELYALINLNYKLSNESIEIPDEIETPSTFWTVRFEQSRIVKKGKLKTVVFGLRDIDEIVIFQRDPLRHDFSFAEIRAGNDKTVIRGEDIKSAKRRQLVAFLKKGSWSKVTYYSDWTNKDDFFRLRHELERQCQTLREIPWIKYILPLPSLFIIPLKGWFVGPILGSLAIAFSIWAILQFCQSRLASNIREKESKLRALRHPNSESADSEAVSFGNRSL